MTDMTKLAVVCFLLCSISYADDIYLKTGFVMRNVQVVDTTNGCVNIERDGRRVTFAIEDIVRVEHREVLPNQESVYELFSQDLHEQYQKSMPERERLARIRKQDAMAARMAWIVDSLRKADEHLDSLYPWARSLYLAGSWGTPQGFRFELGYNFGTSVSLALSFGIGDTWSRDPGEGTVAILGSIRFPIDRPITPYVLFGVGGTIAIFGGSDSYTLIYAGAISTLSSWLQLRPEVGMVFTSRHVRGGRGLFGSSPESTEEGTKFGASLTVEIDFRQLL